MEKNKKSGENFTPLNFPHNFFFHCKKTRQFQQGKISLDNKGEGQRDKNSKRR